MAESWAWCPPRPAQEHGLVMEAGMLPNGCIQTLPSPWAGTPPDLLSSSLPPDPPTHPELLALAQQQQRQHEGAGWHSQINPADIRLTLAARVS